MTEHVSSHEHDEHGSAHPPAEEDVLPSGKIYMVGVVALVVFFFGSLAAGIGMRAIERQVNPDGPALVPYAAGQGKIGIVEQRLFEHSNQGPAWREAAHRRLDSYGWIDQQKGIVHIPIEKAMEMVEKGARP